MAFKFIKIGFVLVFWIFVRCESRTESQSTAYDGRNFEQSMHADPDIFQVTKTIDGDTFWVLNHTGKRIKVRLIGIDAPETRDVFKKKKHPLGQVAKDYLDNMLKQNPYIKLTFDVDSLDQYGRSLAYAYLSDGTMINEQLIKYGYAVLMTIPPNIKFEKTFSEAQNIARENKMGIWKYSVSE